MNDVAHLFTGKAGEHAVASQFLIRDWMVAFPALDLGVDLLIPMPKQPAHTRPLTARREVTRFHDRLVERGVHHPQHAAQLLY